MYRGFRLHPFQQRALDAIRRGSSVIVAAPTGAGKTLVADFAIEQALSEGKRICYTAPVKALSNQKFRDFRGTLGEDRVGIMTGDVTINGGAPLLIMTTEVFRNTIFEDPRNLDDCHAVIFDEIHYLDDRERGTVWEESIIFAPDHIRIVGLSATIPNIEEVADWIRSIRSVPLEVVERHRRPVPLRHFVYHDEAGVKTLKELRHERPRARGHGGRWQRGRGGFNRGRTHRHLVDYLHRHDLLPCLYFSFSRRECGERAEENSHRDLLTETERAELLGKFDELCTLYQLEETDASRQLRRLCGRGILYHHAGLLPVHKEIVERLFTTGLVKLLFTTETFALGVNMPARTVCFASLKKFDGVRLDWMLAREYGQMAGRAGRQGIDDCGYVYSIVDDRDLDYRAMEHLFDGPLEPVRSRLDIDYATLLNLYAIVGERVGEAYERSLARFQRERMERDRGPSRARPPKEAEFIHRRIDVLKRLGYIAGGALTDKGRFAAAVQGFEVHAAEFLEAGLLHLCDPPLLVLLFCAVVFEERRGDASDRIAPGTLETIRQRAEQCVTRFRRAEFDAGLEDLSKEIDWKMSGPAMLWAGGCTWEDLAEHTTVSDGDLVRTFRQAIQVMRNVRNALPLVGAGDLEDRFNRAIASVNRDFVDAKRQLELG
ncbi:MAG: DEAD/DEAH box helicase [Planctomycetes bacterium]|nr:DEAD/DEAH box helicase [Planctomycetota bacterium]